MRSLRFVFALFIISLLPAGLFSQRTLLTMEDVIAGSYLTHRIQNIPQLQWLPGGHTLMMAQGDSLVKKDPVTGKTSLLFTSSRLNAALANIFRDTLRKLPTVTWLDEGTFWFRRDTTWVIMSLKEGELKTKYVVKTPKGAAHTDFCPAVPAVAFTRGQNLFIAEQKGGSHRSLLTPCRGLSTDSRCPAMSSASARVLSGPPTAAGWLIIARMRPVSAIIPW